MSYFPTMILSEDPSMRNIVVSIDSVDDVRESVADLPWMRAAAKQLIYDVNRLRGAAQIAFKQFTEMDYHLYFENEYGALGFDEEHKRIRINHEDYASTFYYPPESGKNALAHELGHFVDRQNRHSAGGLFQLALVVAELRGDSLAHDIMALNTERYSGKAANYESFANMIELISGEHTHYDGVLMDYYHRVVMTDLSLKEGAMREQINTLLNSNPPAAMLEKLNNGNQQSAATQVALEEASHYLDQQFAKIATLSDEPSPRTDVHARSV